MGFAKWSADCSRPARISLRVSIGAVGVTITALYTVDAFLLKAYSKTVRTIDKDNWMWFFTISGFILAISTAFFQLYQSYVNHPGMHKMMDEFRRSFDNFGVIFSYILWIIFIAIYIIISRYETVSGDKPVRDENTLEARNYYATLWVWGIPTIIIHHITFITATKLPIPYIGGYIWTSLIGLAIGIWGLWLVIEGRISIDGYWTNHIHSYPDHKIIQSGIYSHVRHPIYGGQFWLVLSTFIMVNNIWLVFFPIMTAIYNVLRAKKEEKVLDRVTNGKYEKYQDKVPRFMFYPFG